MLFALTFAVHALCTELLTISSRNFDQQTYVSVPLELAPFKPLLARAEALNGGPLKTRGEAHLTVVTPPEMIKLSKNQRIRLLKELARTPLKLIPKCLGVGEANGLKTYFVVVEAPGLAELRLRIGLSGRFYPHVTLGFTERDLHEKDGVRKDAQSCQESV